MTHCCSGKWGPAVPESSGWHKVSERYREACTDLMSEDPLHSLWTEGKSHTVSFPLVCSQRQGQRSDSQSSQGQAAHCWETRAPMSGGDVFGFHLFMFSCRCFLKKSRCCHPALKSSKTTSLMREQVCPGSHTLCQDGLCDLLGAAGSAPHGQGGVLRAG